MASSVSAVGPTQISNEGLSEINIKRHKRFLKDALNLIPDRLLGEVYARSHNNRFDVLTKILDIVIPYLSISTQGKNTPRNTGT